MDDVRSEPGELTPRECVELLSTARIGHLGFHADALPRVLPVAFAVDGRGIVIRVACGSPMDGPTREAVVAFEADDMDPADGRPWCVSVTGVTTEITDPDELTAARSLPLGACGGPRSDRLVRISLELISGRREPATHSGIFLVGDRGLQTREARGSGGSSSSAPGRPARPTAGGRGALSRRSIRVERPGGW